MKIILALFLLFAVCMAGCGDMQVSPGNAVGIQTETKATEEEEADGMQEERGRIICWGDSLTFGEGGDGVTFPLVLEEKLKLEVVNYGVQGETAEQIGIRMGAFPMSVGAFEIPAEAVPAEVSLQYRGEDPVMMRLGDCGINPCVIAGIEGNLSYDAAGDKYYFTRSEQGNAQKAEEGAGIKTFAAADKRASDIIILFAGTNLAPDQEHAGELIEADRQMLRYLGTERYIVVGLTSLALVPDVAAINEALSEEFGEHFLDIRSYLLESGLSDAQITPTEDDKADLQAGEIPSSLRVDIVHGNSAFYRIIGEQIFEKLEVLGYISETDKK